jgi:hypothetical protein
MSSPRCKRDPQAAQRKFCLEETIEEKGVETREEMAEVSQVGQGVPKESFCLIQRQARCKIAFTSGDSSKTEACRGCVFEPSHHGEHSSFVALGPPVDPFPDRLL